ncbi:two-component system, OmpR family, heavy metal sensor histidine kinase CusS [Burkholderia sp. WP9]|jgi:two-component system heavy metal sensor histidine kinase CusS|uniref:heavy metal sensor histidine kinase n=1 Tax=Burkholderia sp. WP9 TaxID=1500263 RepID=UPI0008989D00|nr:heavy metal sensor histidine kinase [Burkholderia sp. WP9]SEE84096.1 two-component system, OmpR family, heavy metal sensor histidine kinase CusS [Burkholderia sp. WP9]
MNRSIARRLAMMFAFVALFVFTLVGTGLFLVLRTQLEHHLRESLDDRTQIARIIVYHAVTPEKWRMAREKLTDMTPHDGSTVYAVSSTDPYFHYGKLVDGPVVTSWPGGYTRVTPAGGGQDMLTSTVTIPAYGARPPVQLQVAASYSPNVRTMRVFGSALAALSALGSLAVLLLSYSVTRLGLAPLTRLTRDASAVSPNNRSQRLNTAALPLELSDLANSFNGALERLDGAYGRLESFNADVAHELRTPVTILIGQTEVALTRNRSVDDLRHTLQSNLEEFERMRAIINDMLFLARADQGERATGLVEVSLAAEAAHTLEFLEIPLEEARVHAQLRGDAVARVNRSLFGRACTNLLMNAIQHCEPGAEINVTIVNEEDQVRVAVANPGAPISPDVLEHLFDRFYRAEVSRTNSRENHGLGLAIVKAIAEMHRGTVSAQSAHGINTFAFSVAALAVEAGMRPVRANASAAAGSADYSSLVKGKSA